MNREFTMSVEPLMPKPHPLQSLITRRQGLIVLGALAIGTGLYLSWGWLVAAGIAPVLVAASPCVAMCALGACHKLWNGGSCKVQGSDTTNVAKHNDNEKIISNRI